MATTATACASCGKQLVDKDVLYSSTGDPICQSCTDQGDVARALHQSAGTGPAAREYEFDGAENAILSGLAGPMRFVGIMSTIFGALLIFLGEARPPRRRSGRAGQWRSCSRASVTCAFAGSWLLPAARALRDVVQTEGNDVTNLMYALKKLTNVYMLQAIMWCLAVVGVVVGVILAIGQHHQ